MHTITRFLITLLIIMASSMCAVGQSRLGRTSGMTQEEALQVAIECVNKAAGFKAISGTHKIVLNRLEDKLEFLGINDNVRLNALIRYLVRNEEVGTQSISFIEGGDLDPNRRFHSYMISSHDLLGIKREWTLLKLVQFIAITAGYAKVPISTSRQIVANCEAYHRDIDTSHPKTEIKLRDLAPDTKASILLASPVNLRPGLDAAKFAQCVIKNRQFGVRSVDFESTKGDAVNYFIELQFDKKPPDLSEITGNPATDFLIYMIGKGWTFDCVAEFITRNAQAKLPKHSLAGQIAMRAIKNNIGRAENGLGDHPFDKHSMLGTILLKAPDGSSIGLNGLISDIKANLNSRPALTACDQGKIRSGLITTKINVASETDKAPAPTPKPILDGDITQNMTVEELIAYIESKLSEIGDKS